MTFRDAVSHLLVSEGLLALAICRLEDGKLNSRGFSNPWSTSWFNYRTVCKDGDFNTDGLLSPRRRCRSASFQTPFLLLISFPGFTNPRLFALWASRLSDVFAHRSSLIAHRSQLATHSYIRPSLGRGWGRVFTPPIPLHRLPRHRRRGQKALDCWAWGRVPRRCPRCRRRRW